MKVLSELTILIKSALVCVVLGFVLGATCAWGVLSGHPAAERSAVSAAVQ